MVVFPTLLATTQFVYDGDPETILILSGDATPVQRAKAYRAIQSGKIDTLLATHSQIFWDRGQLVDIQIVDADSPFYQVYQEPRYTIPACVQKMRELYEIDG